MYTWKVLLTGFIVFLTCLLPLANPVVAQSIEDQSGDHYVKFDLHVVDAFTGKPLDGYVEINAIVADELWKESIEVPERSLKLVYQGSFKNGKASFQVPLHGKYDFIIHAHGYKESPFGDLPLYEPFYGEFIYDGRPEVKLQIKLFPVGYVIPKIISPDGKVIVFKDWEDVDRYNLQLFFGSHNGRNFTHYFLVEGKTFAITIPAGRPSKIYWVTYVPGFGLTWLRADNDAKGYLLRAGDYIVINLVYESAVTLINEAEKFLKTVPSDLSSRREFKQVLSISKNRLREVSKKDDRTKALKAWLILSDVLNSWKRVIIDLSWKRLQERRVGELVVQLPHGWKANITLDYIDFVFGPGWNLNGKTFAYWKRLFKFSRAWLQCPSELPRSRPELIDLTLNWRIKELGEKRLFFCVAPLGYDYYIKPWEIPSQNENIRKVMYPFNLSKALKVSKEYVKLNIDIIKEFNISAIGFHLAEEFDQAGPEYFLWNFRDDIKYIRPPTMEEKLAWLREIISYIRSLKKDVAISLYLTGASQSPLNYFVHERWLDSDKYSMPTLSEGIRYFLDHGIEADIIGIQAHMPHSSSAFNVIELYLMLEGLNAVAPPNYRFSIVEFDVPSEVPEELLNTVIGSELRINEEYQASFVNESMIVFLGNPRIIGVDYVYLVDADDSGKGLLRGGGFPKKAYYTLERLFHSLVYEGEIEEGEPIRTLEGWYNITIFNDEGEPVKRLRIHIDGGAKTILLIRKYENETLRADVKELKERLREKQEKIAGLENEIQELKQDLQSKENLIAELKKRIEGIVATTVTVTATTMIIVTKTAVLQHAQPFDVNQLFLATSLIVLVIAVTALIFAWKHKASQIRDKKTLSQA